MYRILLEIQLTGTNLFTHTTNTWYPKFYEVVHTWNHSNSGVPVVAKYYHMLGKILGFIKNRYCSHFLATFSIQKCNLCYSKLTKILIFASFCFSTLQLFWRKTMSKMTSFAVTKAWLFFMLSSSC